MTQQTGQVFTGQRVQDAQQGHDGQRQAEQAAGEFDQGQHRAHRDDLVEHRELGDQVFHVVDAGQEPVDRQTHHDQHDQVEQADRPPGKAAATLEADESRRHQHDDSGTHEQRHRAMQRRLERTEVGNIDGLHGQHECQQVTQIAGPLDCHVLRRRVPIG
ncbi:MAG: hypothetical protein R3E68_21905, partial [Burkholderiaceae bacterium]